MRMSWWEWTLVAVACGAGCVVVFLGDAYGAAAAFALVGTLLAQAANRGFSGHGALKRVLSILSTVLWVVFAFNVAMEFGSRFSRSLDGVPQRLASSLSL